MKMTSVKMNFEFYPKKTSEILPVVAVMMRKNLLNMK